MDEIKDILSFTKEMLSYIAEDIKTSSFQYVKHKFFYSKRSLGKDGKEIWALKFKTMDDKLGESLKDISKSELDQYGHLNLEGKISKFSAWMRTHFVDEVPQLHNVFVKKDMSIVGVRPMRREDWNNYPSDVKEESLKYNPGLWGIQYAFKDKSDFDACIREIRSYLNQKKKHPISTDIKYFCIINYNIIFKGIRSN